MWFPEYFKRLQNANCNQTARASEDCNNGTNLSFYQDTLYIATATFPGLLLGLVLVNVLGAKILTG